VKKPGILALLPFPQVDLSPGKPRPVLLLAGVPGPYDDWLVCMISTQMHQYMEGFDEVVTEESNDFEASGLKASSVIRASRLAVVSGDMMLGSIGSISEARLRRIRARLAAWIQGSD
jgi:mRNA interferase MazF